MSDFTKEDRPLHSDDDIDVLNARIAQLQVSADALVREVQTTHDDVQKILRVFTSVFFAQTEQQ